VNFEAFLDAELPTLSRYARALTGDAQSAHDVLADALVQAHIHWRRVESAQRPLAYVRRMITNRFLMEQRSWNHRSMRATDPAKLPERGYVESNRVEDRSQLEALLRELPRPQRAAIVLRYYLDLSDADIAAELGCSMSAVRTFVSRGLKVMRVTVSSNDVPAPEPTP
jgi:RNA polymerase sigma-70 factor (sigma-E family)